MAASPDWESSNFWDLFDLTPPEDGEVASYLDVVLGKCVAWFRASGGSVFTADGEGGYVLRAQTGEGRRLPESARIEEGVGIGGIVLQSGTGRIINDPKTEPDLLGQEGSGEIISSLVLPLGNGRGECTGLLNLNRRSGEKPFSPEDLAQGTAVARHLTLAVANARMVSELHAQCGKAMSAHDRLVGVLDSVNQAIFVVDGAGQVVSLNREAAETGVSMAVYAAGENVLFETVGDVLTEIMESRQRLARQAYNRTEDRTWVVTGVPLERGGAVMTVQEITEHERNQREMSRVRRLAEIGQMTAAIAHEIRNPLTGIRSAAQMIRQDPEIMPDFIGMIEEEALKLNALCDEFLDFARPTHLNQEETTLWKAVEPVLTLVESTFREKGVNLRAKTDPEQPTMLVDGRKIGQVVLNLLRNALEASEPGQTVTVEVGPTQITVLDEGSGISPESMEKLFSPFFTTKPDGTGLGLCQSRKTVDAHGGELRVESELGVGTKFEILLDRNLL